MRHLVVCCDGTWNTAEMKIGDVPAPSNVRLFFNALAPTDAEGNPQVPQYFSGVGATGSKITRAVDGSVGHGLSRNIMNAYLWLAGQYRPGDRIVVTGFSRGAYTVRSLVGMLTACGLVRPADEDGVAWEDVRRVYHDGYQPGADRKADWHDGLAFHDGAGPPQTDADRDALGRLVELIGVWDTVGALGVPNTFAVLNLFDDERAHAFHDTSLNAGVHHARHAIALDEQRSRFEPTLWTGPDGEPLRDDRVKQVWFPGVHCDVGGGYLEVGLSDRALEWMIEQARTTVGLGFRDEALRTGLHPDHRGVLHDSCVGIYERFSRTPRSTPRVRAGADDVDSSAVARQQDWPVRQDPYRPTVVLAPGDEPHRVDVRAHEPWAETGLWVENGVPYTLRAVGQWVDGDVPCGPEGVQDAPLLAGIAYGAGSVMSTLEEAYREITGNREADLIGAKRYPDEPWMCLVAAIADAHPVRDGHGRTHTTAHHAFPVGRGPVTVVPERSGYLYAFANDAWGLYDNNRGSVQLTITRDGT